MSSPSSTSEGRTANSTPTMSAGDSRPAGPPPGDVYPWKSWKVANPRGRIGSVIGVGVFGGLLAGAVIWWPFYTVVLLALLETLAVLRFYQEWVEKGAWAK